MESATQLVRRMELDRRTVVVLTGAACAALLVFRRVSVYRDAKKKIQRAKVRRAENLQQAQKAVQQYKEAVGLSAFLLLKYWLIK